MGLIKWFKDKWNQNSTYIVDEETLRKYLKKEIDFSLEHNLEASADFNIYLHGEKHHIQLWNFGASRYKDEQVKGFLFYFDEKEYPTIEELMKYELGHLPKYFKIELTLSDDVFLNEYKDKHPELREEDY